MQCLKQMMNMDQFLKSLNSFPKVRSSTYCKIHLKKKSSLKELTVTNKSETKLKSDIINLQENALLKDFTNDNIWIELRRKLENHLSPEECEIFLNTFASVHFSVIINFHLLT